MMLLLLLLADSAAVADCIGGHDAPFLFMPGKGRAVRVAWQVVKAAEAPGGKQ